MVGRRPLFFPHGQEKVVVPSLIGSSCFVFDWDADQWSGSKKTRRDVEAHPLGTKFLFNMVESCSEHSFLRIVVLLSLPVLTEFSVESIGPGPNLGTLNVRY